MSAPASVPGMPLGPHSLLKRYALSGPEIERRSIARSTEALAGLALPPDLLAIAARMIYAVADPTIAPLIRIHPDLATAAIGALHSGCRIVCDVKMVVSGLNHRAADRLRCQITTSIDDPGIALRSQQSGYPRAAEAFLREGAALTGAVAVVGNAPTALLAVLDLINAGIAKPACIIGIPVGFVAATEAKDALQHGSTPFVTVLGTRGGSALAVAAINAAVSAGYCLTGAIG
ncbi:MAG: precorrin-8X methylmutase [Chloroflexi bacterium]|nr:precorrin-8X methylmutase [Chloroflexota bacterium]